MRKFLRFKYSLFLIMFLKALDFSESRFCDLVDKFNEQTNNSFNLLQMKTNIIKSLPIRKRWHAFDQIALLLSSWISIRSKIRPCTTPLRVHKYLYNNNTSYSLMKLLISCTYLIFLNINNDHSLSNLLAKNKILC